MDFYVQLTSWGDDRGGEGDRRALMREQQDADRLQDVSEITRGKPTGARGKGSSFKVGGIAVTSQGKEFGL